MKTIEIKDFPREVLKQKMLDIMSDGKTRWLSDIVEVLSTDIKETLRAFEELQAENKLFIDSDMMKRL